jgi:thiol:disulfide interchange protein DsbD
MVVDFWASWCPGCRVLDATTLSDPSVRAALEGWFVPVKLDVSEDTAPNKARLSLRRVYSLPAILILDARGVEIDRLGSYLPPDDFLAWLVAARARMPDAVQEQRTAAH